VHYFSYRDIVEFKIQYYELSRVPTNVPHKLPDIGYVLATEIPEDNTPEKPKFIDGRRIRSNAMQNLEKTYVMKDY